MKINLNTIRRALFRFRARHKLKENKVLACQTLFGINTFVETGTYLGEMVNAVKNSFTNIHSIELDEKLAREAQLYFKKYSHIHIHQGDSGFLIKELVKELYEPTIFWLDAHYSEGFTAKSNDFGETPILVELRDILTSFKKGGVILIDDARCFTGQNDYPTISDIENLLKSSALPLTCFVDSDIIHIL